MRRSITRAQPAPPPLLLPTHVLIRSPFPSWKWLQVLLQRAPWDRFTSQFPSKSSCSEVKEGKKAALIPNKRCHISALAHRHTQTHTDTHRHRHRQTQTQAHAQAHTDTHVSPSSLKATLEICAALAGSFPTTASTLSTTTEVATVNLSLTRTQHAAPLDFSSLGSCKCHCLCGTPVREEQVAAPLARAHATG